MSKDHFKTHYYQKDRDNEVAVAKLLGNNPVRPAGFTVPSLSLIRQWPNDGHYEWEIARNIPIGNHFADI